MPDSYESFKQHTHRHTQAQRRTHTHRHTQVLVNCIKQMSLKNRKYEFSLRKIVNETCPSISDLSCCIMSQETRVKYERRNSFTGKSEKQGEKRS